MFSRIFIASTVIAAGVAGPAVGAETFTSWNSPTDGTLGSTEVTMNGLVGNGVPLLLIENQDLSGSDFSAGPGSTTTPVTTYTTQSNWSANFSATFSTLDLYLNFWRGIFSGVQSPATSVSYTFDSPFTVLSGLGGTTVTGNTIEAPLTGFYSGIIEFTNVSEIDLTTNSPGGSYQGLTFGVPSSQAVPEPTPLAALLPGIVTIYLFQTRRQTPERPRRHRQKPDPINELVNT